MPIMPPWRNPSDSHPMAYIATQPDGTRHLITRVGATADDVIAACTDLPPGAVYLHAHTDRHGVALVFRPLPFAADPVPTSPDDTATTLVSGWVPTLGETVDAARDRHHHAPVPAFWTLSAGRVVNGPWRDRADAATDARDRRGGTVGYGWVQPDGTLVSRPAPDDLAWERHLAGHLARLTDADGRPLHSTADDIAVLAIRVGEALVTAGVPLADTTGTNPTGGALLIPVRHAPHVGVAFTWLPHPRTDTPWGSHAINTGGGVEVMSLAVGGVLEAAGFTVRAASGPSAFLVTAGPPTTA